MGLLLFLKISINNNASSTAVVANFYGVNPRSLQRQYKDFLSDFKSWNQKPHAKDWMLFTKNIGSHLSLDETAFSNGDLYTILTNKKTKGKKGTKADVVIDNTTKNTIEAKQTS